MKKKKLILLSSKIQEVLGLMKLEGSGILNPLTAARVQPVPVVTRNGHLCRWSEETTLSLSKRCALFDCSYPCLAALQFPMLLELDPWYVSPLPRSQSKDEDFHFKDLKDDVLALDLITDYNTQLRFISFWLPSLYCRAAIRNTIMLETFSELATSNAEKELSACLIVSLKAEPCDMKQDM